jgi:hypothetical protein
VKRDTLVPVIALLSVGLVACKDPKVREWIPQAHAWHSKVYTSLCSVEQSINLPTGQRLCPAGPGDPGGAPPPPPAF